MKRLNVQKAVNSKMPHYSDQHSCSTLMVSWFLQCSFWPQNIIISHPIILFSQWSLVSRAFLSVGEKEGKLNESVTGNKTLVSIKFLLYVRFRMWYTLSHLVLTKAYESGIDNLHRKNLNTKNSKTFKIKQITSSLFWLPKDFPYVPMVDI